MTDQKDPTLPLSDNPNVDSDPDESVHTSHQPEFSPIRFTGSAKEYWGIWITNLVLTIVTLGVYSAWAKVRRKRYFLNNTNIDGISMIYHATGLQLFKGRAIAFAVIVATSIISNASIIGGLVVAVAFLFVLPWGLNVSMRFNARMTSWRNVRFNWHGGYWKTFSVLWLSILAIILSAGILIPFVSRWVNQYYVRRYAFGTVRFAEDMQVSPFVWAFLKVLLVLIVVEAAILVWFQFFVFPWSGVIEHSELLAEIGSNVMSLAIGTVIVMILLVFPAYSVYSTMVRNIVVNSMTTGDAVRYRSCLNPIMVLWIQVTNTLVTVLTLGLMTPWAQVRIYRYLSTKTEYQLVKDADSFIDEEMRKMGAFGEEFAELEGVDFSL